MKFNKNNMQNFTLLISALALMITMLSMLIDNSWLKRNNTFSLELATILVSLTSCIYGLLIIKRINPKKYIYLSFSSMDKGLAKEIYFTLSDQLEKSSKYRFEILTVDSIPFGNDINITMQKNLEKSDIVLIIVSPFYLQSERCLREFDIILKKEKRIIPIVTRSFSDLEKLPKDISNIKAISVSDCNTTEAFSKNMLKLTKDLIRQQRD